jgi:hypothetical protein
MTTPHRTRAWGRVAVLLAMLYGAATTQTARAEGITIKSAELVRNGSAYALQANYEIGLTATLEDMLDRGITLTFVTEFELLTPRWWTFGLWNRVATDFSITHRLSYNALTRQYRLAYGALHQNFESLAEALGVLGRVRYATAVRIEEIDLDTVYLAALRLRLDIARLPKPLQIGALASNDWSLTSDWYRWTFTP